MPKKKRPVPPAFNHSLEVAHSELDAIDESDYEPVRHVIIDAVVTVLGVARRAAKFRGEVSEQIGEDAAKPFDELTNAAFACGTAQAMHLAKLNGTAVAATVDDLGRLKHVLLTEAQTLVTMKKMPASSLAELTGGTAHKALCLDTLQIVAAFRGDWDAVKSFTAVTQDELDQAESLASVLATTLGENEQGTSPVAPTADQRLRAYTYFVRTYDEVRRAIHFIRWDQGDADEIAPSLSAGRTRHQPAEATPPANHGPIVPIVPITSAGTTASPVAVTAPATPVVGAPSTQPFGPTP